MRTSPFLIVFICSLSCLQAQSPEDGIQISKEFTAEQLVRDQFIKGVCKNVFNIQYNGQEEALGFFSNAAGVLAIDDGLILSSGDVELAKGPNNSVEATASFSNTSMDGDLTRIATSSLFDVAVIEFDFIPVSDQVSFQYVFASEEYCEFVNTVFNDVFGFFVSGPGIMGPFVDDAINVAKVPDSDLDVSINTVNHLTNSDTYIKNELETDAQKCGILFSPNYLAQIQYDGFTIPLRAVFNVIPCQSYHIRLVIGDVGDDKLDSGVFLKSKSFDLGETPNVRAEVIGNDEAVATENCNTGSFIFRRPAGTSNTSPLSIDFILDPASTAQEGVYFGTLPRNIIIPAGAGSLALPVSIFSDNIVEGIESIIVEVETICDCKDGNRAILQISDQLEPQLSFSDLGACAGQPFILEPIIENGVAPYNFEWSTGATTASIELNIDSATPIELMIIDACGQEANANTIIQIKDQPQAELSGESFFCSGVDPAPLRIDFSGQAPWSFSYSINGMFVEQIEGIEDSPYFLTPTSGGSYSISGFRDASCDGISGGTALVDSNEPSVSIQSQGPSCPNLQDGMISLSITGGTEPYRLDWNQVVNDPLAPTELSSGSYAFTITDNQGCSYSEVILLESTITDESCLKTALYIPNVFSPNADGVNDFFRIVIPAETNIVTLSTVQVFSRWGEMIFSGSGNPVEWDGTFQERPLGPGVFLYQVIGELETGETISFSGDVVLIR